MFGLFFFSLCLSEDSLCFDSIFSKHNNNTRGRGREKQREKGVTSKCLLCLFTSFILLFLFLFVFLCQISLDYDLCPSWVLSCFILFCHRFGCCCMWFLCHFLFFVLCFQFAVFMMVHQLLFLLPNQSFLLLFFSRFAIKWGLNILNYCYVFIFRR